VGDLLGVTVANLGNSRNRGARGGGAETNEEGWEFGSRRRGLRRMAKREKKRGVLDTKCMGPAT